MRPRFEVADIFRQHGSDFRLTHALSPEQRCVMRAIEQCRTSVLGGHVDLCDWCGFKRVSYNSCGNRHCPKCQSLAKARWLADRRAELLPVEYFHVVFTLPEQLTMVALQNKRVVYNILFSTAAETLRTIAADPKHLGAEIGFLAVLRSWGQNLLHHPHLHCVVPGGGLSEDKLRWISCRKQFFLPVKVLSRLFRRLFLEALSSAFEKGKLTFHGPIQYLARPQAFARLLASVRRLEWNVYAKPPFAGSKQVLDYLGRYTHRVAISNNRLIAFENGNVTFRWRDYRRGNQQRPMTLQADEFIRRFLLHVLPRGFQRLRQFGLVANRSRKEKLALCRELLGVEEDYPTTNQPAPSDYKSLFDSLTGESLDQCPACHSGKMSCTEILAPLGRNPTRFAPTIPIVSPSLSAYTFDSS